MIKGILRRIAFYVKLLRIKAVCPGYSALDRRAAHIMRREEEKYPSMAFGVRYIFVSPIRQRLEHLFVPEIGQQLNHLDNLLGYCI